ncbi:MAG: hypothetical protein SYC29_10890 [Planctomycetota bacterium]|nr:hypothetical protein [Planctomycetota bacterium]
MFISSPCLYTYAVNAFRLTEGSVRDLPPDENWAIPAIVFAAASLEAFANELGEEAVDIVGRSGAPTDGRLSRWAELFQALEENHAPTLNKIRAAKRFLTGVPFDESRAPFQEVRHLFDLRNGLMHLRPVEQIELRDGQFIVVNESKLLAASRERHLTIDPPPKREPWFWHLRTDRAARWACNTASSIVHEIRTGAMDTELRLHLETFIEQQFQPLPER